MRSVPAVRARLSAAARRWRLIGGRAEALWLSRRPPPPIDPRDRARGVRRIELSGTSVRARIVGAGPTTVVIVPDPPNAIEHYDAVVELLRDRAQVVVFEPPGFGLSFPHGGGFDFGPAAYADVTVELLEHLGLRDVTLVYSCIGGYVALLVARRRPDQVARLILNQTPALADMLRWVDRFDYLGLIGAPVIGQGLIGLVKIPSIRAWYPAALPVGADAAPYLTPALAAQRRGGAYALASAVQSMRTLDPRALAGVRQPTTILWGHADRTHAKTDPRSLLAVVPRATFVSLPGCGHFPDLEDPRRFARIALDPPDR